MLPESTGTRQTIPLSTRVRRMFSLRTGTNWAQQAYLKASNTGPNDMFGGFTAFGAPQRFLAARPP